MVRRITCVIVAALVALGLLTTPASADGRDGSRYYLALGDSLAFGYQPNRDFQHGYVNQLYDKLRAAQPGLVLTNLGCPGETSSSLVNGGKCPYPGGVSQLDTAVAFLHAHPGRVTLVTLDIGGNDVNHCATATSIDVACFNQALYTIAVAVWVTVARLRAAAPRVEMVGMTYYDTLLSAWLTGPAGQALAQQSRTLIHRLNALLTLIFRFAGLRVADVAKAFSTDDLTPVNGVPLNVVRICQWTWMCAPRPLGPDIHANTTGYGVIAQTFAAVL
jgi:lysophospholipase L1-like esterase